MKFPANLTPWAKHLQIFPDEISLILGNYAQKISPFITPLNFTAEDESGEPNGYDGVARRGIYERLLLSELALADDFSDEFVRRAVMGEHLFLNLSKVSPGTKRISIALFDTGAMQIGTPRIAHLAAFIVLARRAEAAGAMFLWGVLQDVKQLVISDDTEASIKILLESRKSADVVDADISEWREKLKDLDKTSDVWLIGSENLARFDELNKFSHLYIEEGLELDKRELHLKIKSASGAERKTRLELPPNDVCTRLLRNPFDIAPPPVVSAARLDGKVTNFFFDSTGAKLFARLDSEAIMVFPVQNILNAGKIHPKNYRVFDAETNRPKHIIAAGRLRKAIAVASKIDDETIYLEYCKQGFNLEKGSYRINGGKFFFPENEEGLLQIYVRPRKSHQDEVAILDAKGNLFLFYQKDFAGSPSIGRVQKTAENVLAIGQTGNKFMFIGCEDGNEYHHLVSISDTIERHSLAGKRLKRAMFGRGDYDRQIYAIEDDAGNWSVLDAENKPRIMPKPNGEVVGVIHDSRLAPVSGFFELMSDQKTLEFCWQYGRRKHILTADAEIVKIEFSPRSPILAYQTINGELVIYSLTYRTAIGRYNS